MITVRISGTMIGGEQLKFSDVDRNQAGMASILITMVMMLVISLIVLGFATVARREQSNTLDQQLSAEAFYAAETGVNDARAFLEQNPNAPAKTQCGNVNPYSISAGINPTVNAAKQIGYSCLLVKTTPSVLQYSSIGTNSTVIPLQTSTGNNFKSVRLTVQSTTGANNPLSGCPNNLNTASNMFPNTWYANCGYGVLRIDLVPVAGNGLSLSGMQQQTMTTFAVPLGASAPPAQITPAMPYTTSFSSNTLIGMSCIAGSAGACSLKIDGLSSNYYYLRISSLYQPVSLQVQATDATNAQVAFEDAQAQIDSTGSAAGVLRRIEVTVPLSANGQNQSPDYALQATDPICKQFAVTNNFFQNNVSVGSSETPAESPPSLCTPAHYP